MRVSGVELLDDEEKHWWAVTDEVYFKEIRSLRTSNSCIFGYISSYLPPELSRYFWWDLPRHADAEIWRTVESATKTRRHTNCPYENKDELSRLGFFRNRVSLLALIAHLRLTVPSDATLWRALEACSAHVARVDRGRPCAMQSYAVGCVHRRHLLHRPPRPHTPGAPFSPPSLFPERVAKRWGRLSRPPGARAL